MVLAPDPPRFTILAATDAYLRAVKKQREELIGRPVFEALPDNPDDPTRSAERNSRASFERAIETRAPDTMAVQKHSILRPESEGGGFEERYWSPVNTPVVDESGKVRYIIHRVEDVTEYVRQKQKDAEQFALTDALRTRAGEMEAEIYRRAQVIQEANFQLRAANEKYEKAEKAVNAERQRFFDVLETLPAMICLLTPDYHVAFANRSFRDKFGESHGRRCYEYLFRAQRAVRVLRNATTC